MQGSRFGRLGKESLKNRTNFTLMQQINPQQFLNDRPLKNTSTLYLDENGKQTQLSQLKSSSFRAKDNQKFFAEQQSHDMEQSNMKDLYALPVVHSSAFSQVGNKSKFNKKLIKSQYMTQRPALDSIRQVNNSDVYNRTEKQKNRHKLLSIKRPKGFLKKGEKFEDIDFIGDNLYEVEDIISDISKIMDHTKRKNIVAASAQPKNPIKNSKWLNNHFGGLNKLDEMLLNYKSFSDESPSIPILENFYRQQKSTEQKKQKPLFKGKMNSFNFPSNSKNSNEYKLSLVVIKWNQMPMIPIKWQADVFLKLQSYPQQEEYRKVVLKAYSTKLRSYSIFLQESAGIVSGKGRINDKNIGKKRLMSEQQYAKAWEQKYPENDNTLNEEQKQILMQFDIEWYRTIIELCYHSGLQDLLEKEYEVQTYVEVMNSLEREEVSVENIIKNQMKYLLQYFIEVYSYGNNQTTMGIIRINNDQNMKIEEVRSNFNNLLNADNGSDNQIQFCVWPLKEDKSSLVVIVQLCGKTSNEYIQMHRNQKIKINMKQPLCTIEMMGEGMMKKNQKQKLQQKQQERQEQEQEKMQNNKINKLIIKNKQDNDWDIYMKIQNHQTNTSQLKITMAQQLLFGLLYRVAS